MQTRTRFLSAAPAIRRMGTFAGIGQHGLLIVHHARRIPQQMQKERLCDGNPTRLGYAHRTLVDISYILECCKKLDRTAFLHATNTLLPDSTDSARVCSVVARFHHTHAHISSNCVSRHFVICKVLSVSIKSRTPITLGVARELPVLSPYLGIKSDEIAAGADKNCSLNFVFGLGLSAVRTVKLFAATVVCSIRFADNKRAYTFEATWAKKIHSP